MRRSLKVGFAVLGVGLLALVATLGWRSSSATSRQLQATPVDVAPATPDAVQHLVEVLRFPTISAQDGAVDPLPFEAQRAFLPETYPAIYRQLELQPLEEHGLLVTWQGNRPELPHIVVLAHQDVVPITHPASWTHPPFAGTVEGGFVWGRGAIDDKGSLIALHEATTVLLEQGFRPERTVHFVFSHDEELGGSGARAASAWLKQQRIPVHAIYDEGLIIADGLVPGIPGRIALIGVTERGYVTLELVATATGGHASMPPVGEEGAVSILASALRRLEDNPMAPSLEGPAEQMFDWIAPEMQGFDRVVFTNRWLFGPIILNQMTKKASTNASLRTTYAATMLRASPQENVLPSEAVASVNFRLHPRDSIDGVRAWVEQTVDDPRVTVRIAAAGNEPSKTARTDNAAFRALQTAFAEVFPGMPVAPGLFVAATDSRWLQEHTSDIYRFQPVPTTAEDLGRIHGVDERIAIEDFGRMIALYERLLIHATQK